MSWPVPGQTSGPRRGRQSEGWEFLKSPQQKRRETRIKRAQYAAGIGLGLLAVHWTKKILKAIPVFGALAGPLLDLAPTVVVGPALGAGVVYVLVDKEGDVEGARQELGQKWSRTRRELHETALDVRDEIARRASSSQRALQPALRDAVDDMERTVVPRLESGIREAQRQIGSATKSWEGR